MTMQHQDVQPHDGRADFDFIIGTWKIRNRRLVEPLTGSTEWEEFDGSTVTRGVWGGAANLEEYDAESPRGHIQGLALRLYNPESRQWSIYWGNRANGTLDSPMIGEFRHGTGEFYNQELFRGRSISVRFRWTDITSTSCRWEQAFSPDGGTTWEINWIMEFTRAPSSS